MSEDILNKYENKEELEVLKKHADKFFILDEDDDHENQLAKMFERLKDPFAKGK